MEETGKRILCLGDSNTYGYDPRGAMGGRYPKDVRWTSRLGEAGLTVFNRGMNGSTVPVESQYGAFSELIASVQPLGAVTVMLGTNDILQGQGAEATAQQMASFLDAILKSAGKAKMLLISPPALCPGDWVQSDAMIAESEQLAAYYALIAGARHIAFADAAKWGIGLAFDGVHFTREGHGAFFEGAYAALKTLLSI